jgi:hypothetical protein
MRIVEMFKACSASALLLSAASCSFTSSEQPSSQAAQALVVINTGEKTYTSATPVELKAVFGAARSFTLSVQGVADGESWAIIASPTPQQATAANGKIVVAAAALSEGSANITKTSANGTKEQATGGAFSFTVAKGRISGSITADPAGLAASISGATSVSCWVPRSSLSETDVAAQEQGSHSTGGDTEPLVEDAEFASSECSSFKNWSKN